MLRKRKHRSLVRMHVPSPAERAQQVIEHLGYALRSAGPKAKVLIRTAMLAAVKDLEVALTPRVRTAKKK